MPDAQAESYIPLVAGFPAAATVGLCRPEEGNPGQTVTGTVLVCSAGVRAERDRVDAISEQTNHWCR